MAEYNVEFARKLAEVAQGLVDQGLKKDMEAKRTVGYLSRLSMEISLKAFLEMAGKPVSTIRKHSHDLQKLLADVNACDLSDEGSLSCVMVPAPTIDPLDVPVTMVLEAERHGASRYPNQFRYGDSGEIIDFPPETLALAALAIVEWVTKHGNGIRP